MDSLIIKLLNSVINDPTDITKTMDEIYKIDYNSIREVIHLGCQFGYALYQLLLTHAKLKKTDEKRVENEYYKLVVLLCDYKNIISDFEIRAYTKTIYSCAIDSMMKLKLSFDTIKHIYEMKIQGFYILNVHNDDILSKCTYYDNNVVWKLATWLITEMKICPNKYNRIKTLITSNVHSTELSCKWIKYLISHSAKFDIIDIAKKISELDSSDNNGFNQHGLKNFINLCYYVKFSEDELKLFYEYYVIDVSMVLRNMTLYKYKKYFDESKRSDLFLILKYQPFNIKRLRRIHKIINTDYNISPINDKTQIKNNIIFYEKILHNISIFIIRKINDDHLHDILLASKYYYLDSAKEYIYDIVDKLLIDFDIRQFIILFGICCINLQLIIIDYILSHEIQIQDLNDFVILKKYKL